MGEELKDLSCPFCRPEIIKPETLVESEHFLLKVPLGAVAEGPSIRVYELTSLIFIDSIFVIF